MSSTIRSFVCCDCWACEKKDEGLAFKAESKSTILHLSSCQ